MSMPQKSLWDVLVTAFFHQDGLVVDMEVFATYESQVHRVSRSISLLANDAELSLRGLMRDCLGRIVRRRETIGHW
jgi:hypothetical protein